MCQRLRSTSAPSGPSLFLAAPADVTWWRHPRHRRRSVPTLDDLTNPPRRTPCPTRPARMTPPSCGREGERVTPERVHARVPVSHVGISSTPWHREIKIHSRLLSSPTDECVSKDRERISNGVGNARCASAKSTFTRSAEL